MAQTEGAQTEGADGSRSCRTHPGVARRMGGMDDGATLDDARRVLARIGRERGKTTVIATVTRLVRRIIGAVEVFGGEDAGGEEVGAANRRRPDEIQTTIPCRLRVREVDSVDQPGRPRRACRGS